MLAFFRFLKLDKKFFWLSQECPVEHQKLLSFVEGLQGSGVDIVAEGVDREAYFRGLKKFGLSAGQGYYWKTITASEVEYSSAS